MITVHFSTNEIISLLVALEKEEQTTELQKNIIDKLSKSIQKATNEDGLWYVVNKISPVQESYRREAKLKLRKILKKANLDSDFSLIRNFIEANQKYQHGLSPALDYDIALEIYLLLKSMNFDCELIKNTKFESNDNYCLWQSDKKHPF